MDAHPRDRDDPVVASARAGDEATFARLVERRSPDHVGRFRTVATRANGSLRWRPTCERRGSRRPTTGRSPSGSCGSRAAAIAEIVAFHQPALFPAFGLPETLPADPADEG